MSEDLQGASEKVAAAAQDVEDALDEIVRNPAQPCTQESHRQILGIVTAGARANLRQAACTEKSVHFLCNGGLRTLVAESAGDAIQKHLELERQRPLSVFGVQVPRKMAAHAVTGAFRVALLVVSLWILALLKEKGKMPESVYTEATNQVHRTVMGGMTP